MVPVIDTPLRRRLLHSLKRIRAVEEAIAERYCEWRMRCPVHLSVGQEGVAAGVGAALRADDVAVSTHRGHAHYLAKGGDLRAMLAEIYGKATGCSSGRGGSMHLTDPEAGFLASTSIVGGTIPIGTGAALALKLQESDRLACVFLGDGATEEGVFYESVNFAVLRRLPVLFLCENNFFSVYSPLAVRQPLGRKIHEMVAGLGLTVDHGDGNDVEEVYRKTARAAHAVRQGNGPFFLEFATYRWREHCGPNYDNDLGYRAEEEYLHWRRRDPVETYATVLAREGVVTAEEVSALEEEIAAEIEQAFRFADESPWPDPATLSQHLYRG